MTLRTPREERQLDFRTFSFETFVYFVFENSLPYKPARPTAKNAKVAKKTFKNLAFLAAWR
jgi:hypothetical protein